jgi:hypothetical protein
MKTTNGIRLSYSGPRNAIDACRGAAAVRTLVAFAGRLAG